MMTISLRAIAMLMMFNTVSLCQHRDTLELARAADKYEIEYLCSAVEWPKWKGSVKWCRAGDISKSDRAKALLRINYFRTLCGLRPVTMNESYSDTAQAAALIVTANERLSHHPTIEWKCYSEIADRGCQWSLLSYSKQGVFPEYFVSGFIYDGGEANYFLGHRRLLLYSRLSILGYGATGYAEAIFYGEGSSFCAKKPEAKMQDFIGYPVPGYNEISLLYPRWSFSIPDSKEADISNAIVNLSLDGNPMPVSVSDNVKDLDHTIVWTLDKEISPSELLEKKVKVTISGVVVEGEKKSYEYEVRFFSYERYKAVQFR